MSQKALFETEKVSHEPSEFNKFKRVRDERLDFKYIPAGTDVYGNSSLSGDVSLYGN